MNCRLCRKVHVAVVKEQNQKNPSALEITILPFAGRGGVCDYFAFSSSVANNYLPLFQQDSNLRDPFFAMDRIMSNMRNSMLDLQKNFVSIL